MLPYIYISSIIISELLLLVDALVPAVVGSSYFRSSFIAEILPLIDLLLVLFVAVVEDDGFFHEGCVVLLSAPAADVVGRRWVLLLAPSPGGHITTK
jgi:hypothetical protein